MPKWCCAGIVILLAMHKMTITDMMGLGIGLSNAFGELCNG
jgi:hypothetical protein